MTKKSIAIKFRNQYGWEMPTLKLARIMYADNKFSFKDVEDARIVLRRLEGKGGGNHKKEKKIEDRPRNPYNLPKTEIVDNAPFRINASRLLVLSDIHLPYHSMEALTWAFDLGKHFNPDAILLNGDTLDFYRLSRFSKDINARDVAWELAVFKDFINVIRTTFPNAKLHLKIGNHEERYQHFLEMKAHELIGVDEFTLENILKARAEGIEIIGDKRIIKAGDLNILHGHELTGGAFTPANIAQSLFNKGHVHAMQGHNHQVSEYHFRDFNGSITTTYSLGCLCDLKPQYMPFNKWAHGCALVEIDGNSFNVINKRMP